MDKLKPLIVHRFWIITSLSLILSLVGWSVGTGTLEEQYESKKSKIEGAFGSLPDATTTPNDDWVKGLEQANAKEQAALDRSATALWDRQQLLMYWPSIMREEMKPYPYLSEDIPVRLARIYRTNYIFEVEKLWRSLDPFNPQNGKGTIQASPGVIPYIHGFDAAPSAKVMWSSMEDIWLLNGLFQAIRSVNDGARTLADAPIRELIKIELRGGSGTEMSSSGEGGGGGVEGGAGGAGMNTEMISSMMGMGGESGGGGSGGGLGNVDIDLTQDVGSDAEASASDGENFDGEGAGGSSEMAAGMMGGGMAGANQSGRRYVDDNPEQKFKTRAFKLHLLMNVDKVPDLLAALNNVSWPVRILRVHEKSRSPEFAGGSGGAGSELGGMMSGMMSGGMMSGGSGSAGGGMMSGGMMSGMMGGGSGSAGGGFGSAGGGFGSAGGGMMSGRMMSGMMSGGFGSAGGGFGAAGARSATRTNTDPTEALEARREMEKAQQILAAAMSDPYLADVFVTGLLTIYQPPKSESETEENVDGSSTESTDSESSSASDDQSGQTPSDATGTDENATSNPETEKPSSLPAEPDGSSSESGSQQKNSTPEQPTPQLPDETQSPSPTASSSLPPSPVKEPPGDPPR